MLVWLSPWNEMQIVCIWSSWCHCQSQIPSSLALIKWRLVLPFWYRLTRVVLEKRPLNGCSSGVVYCVNWTYTDQVLRFCSCTVLRWSWFSRCRSTRRTITSTKATSRRAVERRRVTTWRSVNSTHASSTTSPAAAGINIINQSCISEWSK